MPSLWSILSRWTTRQSPPNSDLRFLQDPLDGAIDELRRDQFRVSSNVTKESRWRGPTTHRGNLAFSHYLNKWEEALSFAKTVRDKTCDKSSVGPRVQQFRWELSQEEKNVADRGGAESDLTDGMTEKLEKYCSLLLSSVCRLPKNATVDDQDAKEFVRLANRSEYGFTNLYGLE